MEFVVVVRHVSHVLQGPVYLSCILKKGFCSLPRFTQEETEEKQENEG